MISRPLGKQSHDGNDHPVRLPIHPGLRALLFSAHWIREDRNKRTKTLRVHMISVTDTTEHIDVLEWAVDPIIKHKYEVLGKQYVGKQPIRVWADKVVRKLFRRSAEIGRLRKQIAGIQKYNERIETLQYEYAEGVKKRDENLKLLSIMYQSALADLEVAKAALAEATGGVSNAPGSPEDGAQAADTGPVGATPGAGFHNHDEAFPCAGSNCPMANGGKDGG